MSSQGYIFGTTYIKIDVGTSVRAVKGLLGGRDEKKEWHTFTNLKYAGKGVWREVNGHGKPTGRKFTSWYKLTDNKHQEIVAIPIANGTVIRCTNGGIYMTILKFEDKPKIKESRVDLAIYVGDDEWVSNDMLNGMLKELEKL